jgi:hypothetical protein
MSNDHSTQNVSTKESSFSDSSVRNVSNYESRFSDSPIRNICNEGCSNDHDKTDKTSSDDPVVSNESDSSSSIPIDQVINGQSTAPELVDWQLARDRTRRSDIKAPNRYQCTCLKNLNDLFSTEG